MVTSASEAVTHVLVVDDDPSVCDLIRTYLGDRDMQVTTVASERDMAGPLASGTVDLVLLDLRLEREDGMDIARRLRAGSRVPIIILTGLQDEADRVMGLELGADDYLTKPFSPRELLARIRALLRRSQMSAMPSDRTPAAGVHAYRFGGWELNMRLRQLTSPRGEPVPLRNSETNLLLAFLTAPQRVLTRDHLLELCRLHNDEVYDRAIDVQVGRLRKKVEVDVRSPKFIVTERGVGYAFKAVVETVFS